MNVSLSSPVVAATETSTGVYRFKTCRTASDLGFHKISYAAR